MNQSMCELSGVPAGFLAVRISGAEGMTTAPACGCFFPALITLLASSSPLLTPGTKLQVHLGITTDTMVGIKGSTVAPLEMVQDLGNV